MSQKVPSSLNKNISPLALQNTFNAIIGICKSYLLGQLSRCIFTVNV